MVFELVDHFLKESDSEETVVVVLAHHLAAARNNHVRQLLVHLVPVIDVRPGQTQGNDI